MRPAIIIQARTGSKRLPKKSVLPFFDGMSMAWWIQCRLVVMLGRKFDVVLAVPEKDADAFGRQFWVETGPESDVLKRYAGIVKRYGFDPVVRITADCPLVDPAVIEAMVIRFQSLDTASLGTSAYLSNAHPTRTMPTGFDVEVFQARALFEADRKATAPADREHVTPYLHAKASTSWRPSAEDIDTTLKLSVDTQQDFDTVRKVFATCMTRHGFFFDYKQALAVAKETLSGRL